MKTLQDNRNELLDYLQENEISFEIIKKVSKEIKRQDKEFIEGILEISKENNWEVAIDDGHKDGFKIISGEEWIKNKSGFEE